MIGKKEQVTLVSSWLIKDVLKEVELIPSIKYLQNNHMKIIEYIKFPQENVSKESWKYLIKVFFWSTIILFLLRGLTSFLGDLTSKRLSLIDDYPFWFVIIVPPVIEELAFRLGLKRTVPFLFISSLSISFLYSAIIFNTPAYSWDNFMLRIVVSILFSSCLILIQKKVFCIKYNYYFYILSILFGLIHIFNFDFYNKNLYDIILIIINVILIITHGMILGYVRVSYGFLYAIIFHIMYNFIPVSVQFMF